MNKPLHLAAIVLALPLASCMYPPPPTGPSTGVSLDRPATGARTARDTRYLQPDATGQPMTVDPNAPGPAITDPNAPGGTAPVTDPNATVTTTPPAPTPDPQPPAPTTPPPATTNTPAAPAELPYGVPVPGTKGFIYSPYDKSAGFVDVQGISPGTKVRCPYTGKIFRVP